MTYREPIADASQLGSGTPDGTKFLRDDLSWQPASGGSGITALTGDVTASGTGSVAATIANDAVTNAKLADMAAGTLKGNNTGGAANPSDLTASQVKTLLAIAAADVSGLGTAATANTSAFDAAGTASAAISSHVAAPDPHPQYALESSLGTLATQNGTFSGTSSGTNTGDQNLFSTIAVSGQSNVVADSTSDTLTLAAGSGIAITTNAGTDTVTIAATGGGGSDIVGAAAPITGVPVNNATTHQTLATKSITVSAGDQVEITVVGTFLNNSGGTVTPNVRFTLGSLNVDLADGATSATNASNRSLWVISGWWTVQATNNVIFGGETRHGTAAAANTAMSTALATNRSIWQTSTADLTGTVTCAVGFRSSTATATQTFTVHSWQIRKTGAV